MAKVELMRKVNTIFVGMMLVTGAFVGMLLSDVSTVEGKEIIGDIYPNYIFSEPFRIDSDLDFATSPKVAGGNGTAGNPWLIENYDVNGAGYGYCIYIGNTTDYFVIKDCRLRYASGFASFPFYPDIGLVLLNVQNGTFENNIVSSNDWYGIYMDLSFGNKILNNSVFSNTETGITIFNSDSNLIANNSVSNNIWYCEIALASSHKNMILNNSVSGNGNGIEMSSCTLNTISNNTVFNNVYGIQLRSSSDSNNITDNKITSNMQGITSDKSNYNAIVNNNVSSNNGHGAYIAGNNNIITNNTLSYNYQNGIDLLSGINNTIANNTLFYNGQNGIHLISSGNIVNNNVIQGNKLGIYLQSSKNNSLWGNTMVEDGIFVLGNFLEHWNTHSIDISNTVNGKPVYYWKNQTGGSVPSDGGEVILANCTNVVVDGLQVNNGSVGISIGFSSNITISNTNALNNYYGIYLYFCNDNTLDNNSASNNTYGIYLISSQNNTLSNNSANSNNFNGIYLVSSNDNILFNNTASDNNYGFSYYTANSNWISNNTVSNNTYGIHFYFSNSNTLVNNTMLENSILIVGDSLNHWNTHSIDISNIVNGKPVYYWKNQTGGTIPALAGAVILANCSYVVVEKQNCSDNSVGFLLGFSSNNTIAKNTASNSYYGIFLKSSNNNTITNNSVSNNDFGVFLSTSNGNIVHRNNFIDNIYQASNGGTNQWHNGYPSGGNYWSDYTGIDLNSTPAQNVPPPDGIEIGRAHV